MKLKFTEGYIIFIESDDKDGWYFAKPWIREAFYEAINHTTIQTLDVMDTNEITKDITFKELNYKLKIQLDKNVAYLHSINKKKTNKMVYFYLNNNESLSSESNNDTYKKVSRFILENL